MVFSYMISESKKSIYNISSAGFRFAFIRHFVRCLWQYGHSRSYFRTNFRFCHFEMMCCVLLYFIIYIRQFHLNIISTFATCDKKKWYNVNSISRVRNIKYTYTYIYIFIYKCVYKQHTIFIYNIIYIVM